MIYGSICFANSEYDKYYIGQTNDIDQRVFSHNNKRQNTFTSKYRPWDLYWQLAVETRGKAMQIEKYLKKKPRAFIRRLTVDKNLVDFLKKKFEILE